MPAYHLLLSHPPHPENSDLQAAAMCLELTPAEMRAHRAWGAPEFWAAERDHEEAVRKASVLNSAGLRVLLTNSDVAARVPEALPVHGFTVVENGLVWEVPGSTIETPCDAKILAVVAEPKAAEASGAVRTRPKGFKDYYQAGSRKRLGLLGSVGKTMVASADYNIEQRESRYRMSAVSMGSGPAAGPRLDLYLFLAGKLQRLSLIQGITKFQGLGDRMGASYRVNISAITEIMKTRFRSYHEDRRLVNVDLPEPVLAGCAYRLLWSEISPELKSADRFDLASRLVFLTYCRFNGRFRRREQPPPRRS